MARPREFNTSEALGQALEVFWTKGYEASSVCDLMAAMGLSKSSLYDSFGSKHELFLKVIDSYVDGSSAIFASALTGDGPGRQAIEDMFAAIVETASGEEGQRGCFVANCAVELSGADEQASRRVALYFKQFEAAVEAALRRGQGQGNISADKDAAALARYLVSSINGIRVMAKVDPNPDTLRGIAQIALQALD